MPAVQKAHIAQFPRGFFFVKIFRFQLAALARLALSPSIETKKSKVDYSLKAKTPNVRGALQQN